MGQIGTVVVNQSFVEVAAHASSLRLSDPVEKWQDGPYAK